VPARRDAAVLDPSTSAPHPSAPAPTAAAGAAEPVDVRTEPVNGVDTPTQLVRDGRLWVVRAAERLPGPGQRWRVTAAAGSSGPRVPLVLEGRDGRWSLLEVPAAGSGEPAWR
jgi:hypothetical protein